MPTSITGAENPFNLVTLAADLTTLFQLRDLVSVNSGFIGFGTSTPSRKLHFSGVSCPVRISDDSGFIEFFNGDNSARTGYVQFNVGSNTDIAVEANRGLAFWTNGGQRVVIQNDGHMRPGSDNTYTWGTAATRPSVLYAATGTINTSDEREKTPLRPLTEAEVAAASMLAREVGAYKFLASLQAKGDQARTHVGVTVQRVMQVLQEHGLEPFEYAFVCYDEWEESVVPARYGERDTGFVDEHGRCIQERVLLQEEVVIPGGNRFSLRADELLLFIARGLAAQLASFEARLAALEAA